LAAGSFNSFLSNFTTNFVAAIAFSDSEFRKIVQVKRKVNILEKEKIVLIFECFILIKQGKYTKI
jgi:hypothetical protein